MLPYFPLKSVSTCWWKYSHFFLCHYWSSMMEKVYCWWHLLQFHRRVRVTKPTRRPWSLRDVCWGPTRRPWSLRDEGWGPIRRPWSLRDEGWGPTRRPWYLRDECSGPTWQPWSLRDEGWGPTWRSWSLRDVGWKRREVSGCNCTMKLK